MAKSLHTKTNIVVRCSCFSTFLIFHGIVLKENEREGRAFVEKVAEHLLGFDAHNDDSLSEFIINTSLEQKCKFHFSTPR